MPHLFCLSKGRRPFNNRSWYNLHSVTRDGTRSHIVDSMGYNPLFMMEHIPSLGVIRAGANILL